MLEGWHKASSLQTPHKLLIEGQKASQIPPLPALSFPALTLKTYGSLTLHSSLYGYSRDFASIASNLSQFLT